jgi:hypothetical protein
MYPVRSPGRTNPAYGEGVVDPAAKLRRIGVSPAGRKRRQSSALFAGHEQQPSVRIFTPQEEFSPLRENRVSNLADFPRAIGLVREDEHLSIGIEDLPGILLHCLEALRPVES